MLTWNTIQNFWNYFEPMNCYNVIKIQQLSSNWYNTLQRERVLQANMGDWYRVLYRGSWSAPGTREAFHGSNAFIGCARFSSSSLYIILPIPDWSLNFDSSSISLVIFGSSGGISSSSSSVSPRLFRRCLTTKTRTVIQTPIFIKHTQQNIHNSDSILFFTSHDVFLKY